jgi:murein DD-endopeptidase MepM/ murein hydrolase activator NlpD
MKNRFACILGLVTLLTLALLGAGGQSLFSPDSIRGAHGEAVLIQARSYAPGDILLVTLAVPPAVREARVAFLKRDYILKPREDGGEPLALIGLDLGLKPGRYDMDVTLVDKDNRRESRRKSITVIPRKFPSKKLVLPEKYVVPPAKELERIRREAARVTEVYSRSSERWLGEGWFILPHEAQMLFNFGERRVYNNETRSVHSGVDIEAPLGSAILASNSGTVALAADLYFSGKTVILDHGLGVSTSYFHMSRLLVRTGDVVPKGDTIGEAGSTGRSTGPHLHWAVRVFDSRVDPRSLIRLPLGDH